jgi:hypothetical protein
MIVYALELRDWCALELRVIGRALARAEMSSANYASRSAATPQGPHGRNVQPGAPGDYATLIENTPIQAKLQPQPKGARNRALET